MVDVIRHVVEPTPKIDRTGPKYALIVPRFQRYTVFGSVS